MAILKEADNGVLIKDVMRNHGISVPTYYKWKSRYGGMDVAELARVRELEQENAKLTHVCRTGAGDSRLAGCDRKKALGPLAQRQMAQMLVVEQGMSVQRSCRASGLARSGWYRSERNVAASDAELIDALQAVVARHGRWGFWKCFRRLRLDGHGWNHKRVWRVYCQLKLNLPRSTKKRLPRRERHTLEVPMQANALWSMDFMADTLYGGRRFRTFNVLDEGVREALAIEIDTSLRAERVVRVLEQLKEWRGLPQAIRCDNGPEYTAELVVDWCRQQGVELRYIQPGKPNQNAYIERFNKSYRNEVLDAHLFEDLDQVRETTETWLQRYNEERPHESLGNLPPSVYREICERTNSPFELSA